MVQDMEKDCFGILDRVFPLGEEGLRHVPEPCFECEHRVDCMKEALNSPDGIEMRMEMLSRSKGEGLIGWIKRWSQMKELHRMKKLASKGDR